MRKKDEFMSYVENRLRDWAKWYKQGNAYGVGLPKVSIEYLLWKVGIVTQNLGLNPLPENKEAEEIEALVKEMAEQEELKARVLRKHYFSNDDTSIRENAKKLRIHHSTFQRYLFAAHQWMEGRLTPLSYQKRGN